MFLNRLTGTQVGFTAWDMFVINKPALLTVSSLPDSHILSLVARKDCCCFGCFTQEFCELLLLPPCLVSCSFWGSLSGGISVKGGGLSKMGSLSKRVFMKEGLCEGEASVKVGSLRKRLLYERRQRPPPLVLTSSGGHWSWWYASYWNASLFHVLQVFTWDIHVLYIHFAWNISIKISL